MKYKKIYIQKLKIFELQIEANSYEEFKQIIEKGGFVYAHWDGTNETELQIKNETKATIRCITMEPSREVGECMISGKPSERRVLFAKAY